MHTRADEVQKKDVWTNSVVKRILRNDMKGESGDKEVKEGSYIVELVHAAERQEKIEEAQKRRYIYKLAPGYKGKYAD
jgi:hypothetical protein